MTPLALPDPNSKVPAATMASAATHAWHPHCGMAPAPGELLARWNLDPDLPAALALA